MSKSTHTPFLFERTKEKYATGLVMTLKNTKDPRFFFFELDREEIEYYDQIKNILEFHRIDFLTHRTGGGGIHFLSPTLISKDLWKSIHNRFKHINKKCPMTILRVTPNKYVNESDVWYKIKYTKHLNTKDRNNDNMCTYLNHIFQTPFEGSLEGEIQIVRYPLP